MEFDKPLYYSDSWACGCNSASYCATKGAGPVVDESEYNITELKQDEWLEMKSDYGDVQVLKLFLPRPSSDPCVALVIDFVNIYGFTAFYISTDGVPDGLTYLWAKWEYTSHNSMWFCPDHDKYVFGWWYIATQSRFPRTYNTQYRVRWRTKVLPDCAAYLAAPILAVPGPTENWTLLRDSISQVLTLNTEEAKYMRYYIPNRCGNITINGRHNNNSEDGDIDIYLSLTDNHPHFMGKYDWVGFVSGDDSVTAINVCVAEAPLIFYITLYAFSGVNTAYTVTASSNMELVDTLPLAEIPPGQLQMSLVNSVRMHCGNEQSFGFEYSSYPGCVVDGFNCSFPLRPIASITPYPNVLYPPSNFETPLHFLFLLDPSHSELATWTTSNTSLIRPNRLTFTLVLRTWFQGGYTPWVATPVDQCTLSWHNKITDADYQPIEDTVLFTKKNVTCSQQRIVGLVAKMKGIISQMQLEESISSLNFLWFQLQSLIQTDSWTGCRDLLDKLVQYATQEAVIRNSTVCKYPITTGEFNHDPCCGLSGQLLSCCLASDATYTFDKPSAIFDETIDTSCGTPDCIKKFISGYVKQTADGLNTTNGCIANWRHVAGPEAIDAQVGFAKKCRVDIMGQSLSGAACKTEADCLPGRYCSNVTGTCDHNSNDVVDCWVKELTEVNSQLGQLLYSNWGITAKVTADVLKSEITKRYSDANACIGQDSVVNLPHWHWEKEVKACEDTCLEPDCLETDETYCYTPPDCLLQYGEGRCPRQWLYVSVPPPCEPQVQCSWMDCTGLTETECNTRCHDPAVPEFVCVYCDTSKNNCTRIESITTEAECNIGVCDVALPGAFITDQAACLALGSCSLSCPTCNTEAGCLAQQYCSTRDTVDPFIHYGVNPNGICVSSFYPSFWGDVLCGNEQDANFTALGCVNSVGEAACTGNNLKFFETVTTESQCTNLYGEGCYNPDSLIFNEQTEAECEQCGRSWQPYYTWVMGEWTTPALVSMKWVPKEVVPIHEIGPSIDYKGFEANLEAAILIIAAPSYTTNALCQYSGIMEALIVVSCDCNANDTCSENFEDFVGSQSSVSVTIGVFNVCPYITTSLIFSGIEVTVQADTAIKTEPCKSVNISSTYVSLYTASSRKPLASASFFPRPPNAYTVVFHNGGIIGQVASNGYTIVWEGEIDAPLMLCIMPLKDIEVYSDYSLPLFATVDPISGDLVGAKDVPVWLNEFNEICGNVSKPGTYIASWVDPDWESLDSYGNRSDFAMTVVSAILYYLVCVACVVLLVLLPLNSKQSSRVKYFSIVILFLFGIARGIFFSIPPSEYANSNVATLFGFEIPTFLLLVAWFGLICSWVHFIVLSRSAKSMDKKYRTAVARKITAGYIFAVAIITTVFIAFIIAYYTLPADAADCALVRTVTTISGTRESLNLAYQSYVAGLTVVVAFIVVATSLVVVVPVARQINNISVKRKAKILHLMKLTVLLSACASTFFIVKSCLILSSGISQSKLPILLFCLLEVIPCAVFCYYFAPHQTDSSSHSTGASRTT